MSWGLFGQIVLLMAILILLKTFIGCMHEKFCLVCHKGPAVK